MTSTIEPQTPAISIHDESLFHLTEWLENDVMKSWNPPQPPLLHSPDRSQLKQILNYKFARLKTLQKEADELWMEIVKDQVTLSPIRLLPVEILSHILCLAAKGNWDDVEFQLHNPDAERWSCSNSILLVCKKWHSLAMSTPSFWSHIDLTTIPVESFKQSLARSVPSPLHLLAFRYTEHGEDSPFRSPTLMSELSIALASHRKQVETFGEDEDQSVFLGIASIPAQIGDISWDNLRHLRLHGRSSSNPIPFDSSPFVFPKLLSLYIRGHDFPGLPRFICPILKSLSLISTVDSFEQLYKMVKYSPALTELKVSVGHSQIRDVPYPSNDLIKRLRLTLVNVKSLQVIKEHSTWPYHAMWSCCPSLENFVIHNEYHFIPPFLDSTLIHTSVKTFTLHTIQTWGGPALRDPLEQCWHFWLNAFPALDRITVTSSIDPSIDPDQEDETSFANNSRFATTLLTSLTHIRGKGGPKPLLNPQLTEISLDTQVVDILALLSFAEARLQDHSGRFCQKLTDISSDSDLMPITLKLTNCEIDHPHRTVAFMSGVRGIDDQVNWTLTTFEDLDNAIIFTQRPVVGPNGWKFEGL